MSIALALFAMLLLGSTHFINGLLSRHYPALNIGLFTHLGGAFVALPGAMMLATWAPGVWTWGALAGIGSALGALLLYRSLSQAAFALVVPVSSVAMVVIALALSLLFLDERPGKWVWFGVMVALPAIWLTAGGRTPKAMHGTCKNHSGLWLGLGAGAGFALQLFALAQVPDPAAEYGIAVCMLAGAALLLPFYRRTQPASRQHPLFATAAGGISALGLTLYALSREGQLAMISILIVSLYPLIPVILGSMVRQEPIGGYAKLGIALSMMAMMLVTVGSD
ncbi:drug/metabolite transporter [Halomonas sp. 141]|uniref:DMT family transporter n=1 Tax=unclassified Halomonas TaxID=2609666 RepID=UPI000C2B4DF4|nr:MULTISPECIES: DMT family transporter [unclassified Halomonas]PJX15222.1 drug/metabolite transporter [Halomonas sp. 141]